jgi:hypothetical protein
VHLANEERGRFDDNEAASFNMLGNFSSNQWCKHHNVNP